MPPDKARLGKRYTCFSCGAHFYDLNKPEAVCPACGADQAENPNPDPRELILAKYKGKGGAKPAKREAEPEEDESVPEEDEFLDGDDEEDDDMDLLGEDEGGEVEEEEE